MTLNDPELVRAEYASEAGLESRRSLYDSSLTFADGEAIRTYVRALGIWKKAADTVPELTEPLQATTRNTIFVAPQGIALQKSGSTSIRSHFVTIRSPRA